MCNDTAIINFFLMIEHLLNLQIKWIESNISQFKKSKSTISIQKATNKNLKSIISPTLINSKYNNVLL